MGEILYNVKKVVLHELNPITGLVADGSVAINIDCDSSVELDPVLSKGEEKVQRDDTKILAIAKTNDLLYGYTVKLTNSTFDINAASLIEGGLVRKSGETIIGYDSPMLNDGVTMKPFKMEVYIANYSGTEIKNYIKITFNYCTGQATKFSFKKDFFSPEFDVDARENTKANLTVKAFDFVDTLPADDVTAPVLTMVSTSAVTKPATIDCKSNKLGAVYAVIASASVVSASELNTLVNAGVASVASVDVINSTVNIATSSLAAGSYKVYAVDYSGNISTASSAITLS